MAKLADLKFKESKTGANQVYPHPCMKCEAATVPGQKVWAHTFLPEQLCESCYQWFLTDKWKIKTYQHYYPVSKGKFKDRYRLMNPEFTEAVVVALEIAA